VNTTGRSLLVLLALLALTAPAAAQQEKQEVIELELVHSNGEVFLQDGYVTTTYYEDDTGTVGDYRYRVLDQNGTTKRIGSFSFNRQISVEGQGVVNATGVTTTLTLPYDTSYDQAVIYKDGVQQLAFDLPRPTEPDSVYVAMSGRSPVNSTGTAWPIAIGFIIALMALIAVIASRYT